MDRESRPGRPAAERQRFLMVHLTAAGAVTDYDALLQ
jgi:hypothetical protein